MQPVCDFFVIETRSTLRCRTPRDRRHGTIACLLSIIPAQTRAPRHRPQRRKKSIYSLNQEIDPTALMYLTAPAILPIPAETLESDNSSLHRVIKTRKEKTAQYFNSLAAAKLGKKYCPGRSWQAVSHLLVNCLPH